MRQIQVGDRVCSVKGARVGHVASVEGNGKVLLVAWKNERNSYVTSRHVRVLK